VEVSNGNKTFTVDTTNADIRNNNGDRIDSSDLNTGDKVAIHGDKTDSNHIDAAQIGDISQS
jgi:hypothetical protein